jgi:hypothetical protein
MPIECGSGGLTKFNRTMRDPPKQHWLDAACVGKSTLQQLHLAGVVPFLMAVTGHGSRQKCNVNGMGFPCSKSGGSFDIRTKQGRVQWIGHHFCTAFQRCDCYSYMNGAGHSSPL